jgi:hypothetical protein
MPRTADRNLLLGILALQTDVITRDALIAAMNAWAVAKHRPLEDILVEQGALEPADRDLLRPMVDRHIARHGGPEKSLQAISRASDVAADLNRAVADRGDPQGGLDPRPAGHDDGTDDVLRHDPDGARAQPALPFYSGLNPNPTR